MGLWLSAISSSLPLSFLMSSLCYHFLIFDALLLSNHLPDDGWLWRYLCSFNDWKNYYCDFFLFRIARAPARWYYHSRSYERTKNYKTCSGRLYCASWAGFLYMHSLFILYNFSWGFFSFLNLLIQKWSVNINNNHWNINQLFWID